MPALRTARFASPQILRKGSPLLVQALRRTQTITTMADCKTGEQGSPYSPRYIDVSVLWVSEVSVSTADISCQSLLTPGFTK